jgi:hypothetical protein
MKTIPAAGSNSFFKCAGALRQHQLAGGPYTSLQQVTAVRRAIAFSYHDMGMNLWLTVFQSHVAD